MIQINTAGEQMKNKKNGMYNWGYVSYKQIKHSKLKW